MANTADSIRQNSYYKQFKVLKDNQFVVGNTSFKERIAKLIKLKKAVEVTYRDRIKEALYKDLGKPAVEGDLSEIFQIVSDIKFVKRHLRSWMKNQRVETPITLLGSSSYIKYEPKGVCLIISPWNFPFNLTFGPLISAIAAGNTVMLKPSEMTPHSSSLMAEIVDNVFSDNEVILVQGEVQVSQELLKLPFNHIFFTGSPNVGKIVMNAAAKHLSSVTLELGGKSPTIIDKTANIKTAAKKIIWGKFMNCGQICVSPDYVLVDQSVKDAFVAECKKWLLYFYTNDPKASQSYGRIVNIRHFNRLKEQYTEAKKMNATIEVGGDFDETKKYISPTIISNLQEDAALLNEEIFGPLLPVVTYNNLDEAINYINNKEKPLALYIYSKSSANTKKIINNTRAGGTCINNNVVHYANHNLPFGGSNNSGIGKSHGFFGFLAFSNERAIVKQHFYGVTELLFPPYTNLKEKLAQMTIKWF